MIKLDGEKIEFKHFNDGSYRLKYKGIFNKKNTTLTWLYDAPEELLQLYYITRHLQNVFLNENISLNMPYVIDARNDRTPNNEIFTLKYSCELINSLKFGQIHIYDPHSYVAPALLNNVCVENPANEIALLLKMHSSALMFYPDEGSWKRLHSYFDCPYAFGVKERDFETQKICSLQIAGAKHMIAGHDIIICDDILSRGSTLYGAAKQLKEMGANNIYVWISHCENTVLQPHINGQSLIDIPNLITKIYTTNSIYRANHSKIEVIKKF